MARNEIKLNIVFCESQISEQEKAKRIVELFNLLFEWKLAELQNIGTEISQKGENKL